MGRFLPGIYEETATEGRYTFTGGSTAGGAILYDGGRFLYSHHATDPAGGKLVNSFDLVRLALKAFGIRVRRNLITGKIVITGMPEQYSSEEAVNTLPVFLMDRLRAIGVKGVSKTAIIDYLGNIADESRFNPVVDMLETVQWDGQARFPELLRIIGIPAGSLYSTLVRKWLIQTGYVST